MHWLCYTHDWWKPFKATKQAELNYYSIFTHACISHAMSTFNEHHISLWMQTCVCLELIVSVKHRRTVNTYSSSHSSTRDSNQVCVCGAGLSGSSTCSGWSEQVNECVSDPYLHVYQSLETPHIISMYFSHLLLIWTINQMFYSFKYEFVC